MSGRPLSMVLVMLATVLTSGCGVSAESRAHRLDEEQPGAAKEAQPGAEPTLQIYLVRAGRLFPVTRPATEASPESAMKELLAGPTAAEGDAGISTAISPSTRLRTVREGRGVVTVDLSEVKGGEQIVAVAQIVFTLTALPDVEAVRLEVDGEPADAPRAHGDLTRAPLRRTDFAELAPP